MTTSPLAPRTISAVVAAIAVALLFIAPPVGFVAVAICLVLLPPWGKSLSERAVISGLVLLGVVALVFPRAGSLSLDHTTSRITLAALLLISVAIGFLPSLRSQTVIPRPRWVDLIVAATALIAAWSPIALYRGASLEKVISGLYFSGWDNQGHFTTFANTLASQSTTWPTADGVIAWNQWYPSLHTTTYALMQQAISSSNPDRLAMVEPFALWSALAFAACLAALTFSAALIAERIARRTSLKPTRAAIFAALGMAIFTLLGSVNYLFNAGFTNFLIAVTAVITTAAIVTRSARSARLLGWFLIPLAGLAVIGLWTPLVIGLLPVALITAVSLWKWRKGAAIGWIAVSAVGAVVIALSQLQAILAGSEGASVTEFNEQIGQVGVGMPPFNLGLGIAAPVIAVLLFFLLRGRTSTCFALGVTFPAMAAGLLAIFFSMGSDAAELSRLASYYVLKALDAALLAIAPAVIAVFAVGLADLLRPLTRVQVAMALGTVALISLGAFGYVGMNIERMQDGFDAAPGVTAGQLRLEGAGDELVGTAIVAAANAAQANSEYVPLLWDGSGHLVNLWVGSLTNNMSFSQTRFYGSMPPFPYEDKAIDYLTLAQNSDPSLDLNIMWFRPPSGEALENWARMVPPQRAIVTRLDMPASPLCPECAS